MTTSTLCKPYLAIYAILQQETGIIDPNRLVAQLVLGIECHMYAIFKTVLCAVLKLCQFEIDQWKCLQVGVPKQKVLTDRHMTRQMDMRMTRQMDRQEKCAQATTGNQPWWCPNILLSFKLIGQNVSELESGNQNILDECTPKMAK